MSPAAALMLEKEIYPIIRNTVPRTVRPMGSEDPEELVQDATASAAEMLEAMEKAGKVPLPHPIAYYSIQRTKSGRRSYGDIRTDVMSPGFQMDNEGSGHSGSGTIIIETGRADKSTIWPAFYKEYKRIYGDDLTDHKEPDPLSISAFKEPKSLDGTDLIEDRFSRLVRDAYEKEEITTSRAAEMLNIGLAEMRERACAWAMVK